MSEMQQRPGPGAGLAHCQEISLPRAVRLFEERATAADRLLFPSGPGHLCHRAFGVHVGGTLVAAATIRDARSFYDQVKQLLPTQTPQSLRAAIERVGIYQPDAVQRVPAEALPTLYRQLAWIAMGGERGWRGSLSGTELFCRFVMPEQRGRGFGMQLIDHLLTVLEREGKLPLRAIPASNSDRTYGGRADGKRLIKIDGEYFRRRLSAA